MPKATIEKLTDLIPDAKNANKGTERGAGMLETSLREYGAGRSLLVDRNGVVIAGNKTLEAAAAIGIDDVVVVPTDGSKLVIVQRTDLDLQADPKAKALAVADNRVAQVDLSWDTESLESIMADGADLSHLWHEGELMALLGVHEGNKYDEHWTEDMPEFVNERKYGVARVVVHFVTEEARVEFFEKLNKPPHNKFLWYPDKPNDIE